MSLSRSRDKTMFRKPKSQKLAKMVSIESPTSAKIGASMLVRHFNKLSRRPSKVATKRAAVLAANRAGAMLKKKDLSRKERVELRKVRSIYRKAVEKMQL